MLGSFAIRTISLIVAWHCIGNAHPVAIAQPVNQQPEQAGLPGFEKTIGEKFPRVFEMGADGRLELAAESHGIKITASEFLADKQVQEYLELTKIQASEIEELTRKMKQEMRQSQLDLRAQTRNGNQQQLARFAQLVLIKKQAIMQKFERAYSEKLLPHQRNYYTQFLHWVRIRDGGLANELVSGPIGKQLEISSEQKRSIKNRCGELHAQWKKEIANLEDDALKRYRAATPTLIRKFLDDVGFFDVELSADIDHLVLNDSSVAIDQAEINALHFNEAQDLRLVQFQSDIAMGLQHGRRTNYRGNFDPINLSFKPPYIGNPVARMLVSKPCQDKLKLTQKQKSEMNRLDKQLGQQFGEVFRNILNETGDNDAALKQIQANCKSIVFQMLQLLSEKQIQEFSGLLMRHRMRTYGFPLAAKNLAHWQDIEISEREFQRLLDEHQEIQADVNGHLARIEDSMIADLLGELTKEQQKQFHQLVGECPDLMQPNVNRLMLDLATVSNAN